MALLKTNDLTLICPTYEYGGGLSAGLDTKTVAPKFQNNERQLAQPFQDDCAKMTYYTTGTH
jgi:hypothetical protein